MPAGGLPSAEMGSSPPVARFENNSTSLLPGICGHKGAFQGGKDMPTVSRSLPAQPHLDVPRREARELLKEWREGLPEALDRIRKRHPKFLEVAPDAIATSVFKLADAQLVI